MRTIKFKGICITPERKGETVYGSLLTLPGENGTILKPCSGTVFNFWIVDPDTICQFTGFLDKNGKEIYEGDVLRSDNNPFSCIEDNAYDNYYGIVGWSEFSAAFYVKTFVNPKAHVGGIFHGDFHFMSHYNFQDFEVVGSIHDEEWQKKLNITPNSL